MATEKRNLLKGDFSKKNALLFALAVLVTIVLWNLPTSSFGIEGLTVIQQRIIAVFALATILWEQKPFRLGQHPYRLSACCCSQHPTMRSTSSVQALKRKNCSTIALLWLHSPTRSSSSSSAVSSSLSQQQNRDLTCFWHALFLSLSATRAIMCSSASSSSPAYSQCSSATPQPQR